MLYQFKLCMYGRVNKNKNRIWFTMIITLSGLIILVTISFWKGVKLVSQGPGIGESSGFGKS